MQSPSTGGRLDHRMGYYLTLRMTHSQVTQVKEHTIISYIPVRVSVKMTGEGT
jgi:hypothetical protein